MKLYNSLSGKIEPFKTLRPNKVSMYVCGITPYDTTHLGHAFTYVFFDVLVRFLQYKGYETNYTQNVTDIDDDILKRAKRENKNWKTLGKFWTDKFLKDMKNLNVLLPVNFVKATDSITSIIEITKILIKKGFAYERMGNVYFEVKKFEKYGSLSKLTGIQMIKLSKERGANPEDPLKKDPLDFVLWQLSKLDEPYWNSPWGKGRPGWHIECSAMIHDNLGKQIDIHGGGADLIYPHHESEIAQSEAFIGKNPFVKYWMHTGMLYYKGEKMSKSLGNLIMVSDLLKKYSPNAIRYVLLSHHYRKPWQFKESQLRNAEKILIGLKPNKKSNITEFLKHMDNDMDIPKALKMAIESENSFALQILGFK